MDTVTLWTLALNDPVLKDIFGGVYACDRLPEKTKHFKAFIVNLDPASEPGSHWVAIYFENGKCYYFCSYGTRPKILKIRKFIYDNARFLEWNEITYQGPYSKSCGHFCLYFLWHIARKKPLHGLSRNTEYSENVVEEFVKNNFELISADSLSDICQTCSSMIFIKE